MEALAKDNVPVWVEKFTVSKEYNNSPRHTY